MNQGRCLFVIVVGLAMASLPPEVFWFFQLVFVGWAWWYIRRTAKARDDAREH